MFAFERAASRTLAWALDEAREIINELHQDVSRLNAIIEKKDLEILQKNHEISRLTKAMSETHIRPQITEDAELSVLASPFLDEGKRGSIL